MTRSSNEINDLFSGYSLKLHTTNSSAINISSSQNLSTIEGLINDFITSYNAVYGGISALSVGGTSSASSGPLSGDSLARQIQREIRSYTSDQIAGYEGGPYSLALLGIQTQRDGSLALNSNTLIFSAKATLKINKKITKK